MIMLYSFRTDATEYCNCLTNAGEQTLTSFFVNARVDDSPSIRGRHDTLPT